MALTVDRRRERLLSIPRWPTREEAAQSRWFSPVRVGALELRHRTWVPAMVPWRATDDGFVTPEVLGWYERFAEGQPGAIVVEATGIRDVPSGPLLRAGHDRYIEGLTKLSDTVHRASRGRTRVFLQLIDFLAIKRRPEKAKFFERFLALNDAGYRSALAEGLGDPALAKDEPALRTRLTASDDRTLEHLLRPRDFESYSRGFRERVTDVHVPHIQELPRVLPDLFAQAARRAQQAGFDGVELHYAHAYTMASFLSALNDRADGYGGSRENRARLPLEVFRAVRSEVGNGFVVGCRFLGDEVIDGGNSLEDAEYFAVQFAREGFDFLSLSKGGKFEDARQPKVGQAAYPYTGISGAECMPTTNMPAPGPFGRNVGLAAGVRRAVREAGFETPVVTCGGICSFWQAEAILQRGDADLVASARQSLADPDWFRKTFLGLGDQVRRCLFTNYCEGLDQAHKSVTCQLWDRQRDDADSVNVPRTKDGRRLTAPRWTPPRELEDE